MQSDSLGAEPVTGAKDLEVMKLVTRDDVGHRPDRYRVVAGGSSAAPRFVGDPAKEGDRCRAHKRQLVGDVGELPAIKLARWRVGVLIEPGQGRLVAPGNPK